MSAGNIKVGQLLISALCVLGAVVMGIIILMNPTGGIAGLSKFVTAIGVIVSLANPRAGLFFLAAQAIYADELKRLGVYYGAISQDTVREILIGPILTIATLNVAFLLNMVIGRVKIDKIGWFLYALAPIIAVFYFLNIDATPTLKAYNGATAGGYVTIVVLCYGLLKNVEDWKKFIKFQCIVAAPAAAWGIWQYYNGFNDIEWTYARTWLSLTHSGQMMMFDNPRIFGLFGSASALGCVGIYGIGCFWLAKNERKHRWLMILIGILYFAVTIYSRQRAILVLPYITIGFIWAFYRRWSSVMLYVSAAAVLLAGIFSASWFLHGGGIETVNAMLQKVSGNRWAKDVLSISTFSDRFVGWERLTKASSWTWFGENFTGKLKQSGYADSEYSHDLVNKILVRIGGVGAILLLGLIAFFARQLHQIVWNAKSVLNRRVGAFALGVFTPAFITSMFAGDNLTTTPTNLQFWSFLAGVFVLRTALLQQKQETQLSNRS